MEGRSSQRDSDKQEVDLDLPVFFVLAVFSMPEKVTSGTSTRPSKSRKKTPFVVPGPTNMEG